MPAKSHYLWWLVVLGALGLFTYLTRVNEALPTASLDLKLPRSKIEQLRHSNVLITGICPAPSIAAYLGGAGGLAGPILAGQGSLPFPRLAEEHTSVSPNPRAKPQASQNTAACGLLPNAKHDTSHSKCQEEDPLPEGACTTHPSIFFHAAGQLQAINSSRLISDNPTVARTTKTLTLATAQPSQSPNSAAAEPAITFPR